MATEVVMPQMGESIAEGTIVRWIKKVGDKVDRDEPLFEISTDKVDAEIPSPAAGVLSEIRAKEGETVPVNSVVAVIGAAGEAKAAPAPTTPIAAPTPEPSPAPVPPPPAAAASASAAPTGPSSAAPPAPSPAIPAGPARETAAASRTEDVIRQRSSPLVRKIAKEHQVDISQLHGSGIAGRVTKADILEFIGKSTPAPAAAPATGPAKPPVVSTGQDVVERMSVMRKRIAEHMIASRRTSAHVHSVFEVNFSRVAAVRTARQAEFERAGAKLTYLSFIIKAAVDALREMPVVNASIDGDNVVYHHQVNVGIAVALDWGLIVPVIRNADEKSLLGISRTVADLANRARAKQLKPEEVQGGTFTVTNPGVFGALLGMPIISQPQVAILGVGAVEKRPVVVDDAIAIRPMAYLTLGYDHRLIDGAVADQFMSLVKKSLENWDPAVI
jgi:pyruvate dehydrogenase E2 component (dihydrolipoamide acetyltransferase)